MRNIYRPPALILALMVSLAITQYIATLPATNRITAACLIAIAGAFVGMLTEE